MPHAYFRTGLATWCAVTATVLAPAAWAGPSGAPASVVVSTAQPQVQVLASRRLSSTEFAELRGEYRLNIGGSLVVGGARHRPVVELNDRPPMPLLAVAPNQLVSADGRLQLVFRTEANGEVSGLTVSVVPSLLPSM